MEIDRCVNSIFPIGEFGDSDSSTRYSQFVNLARESMNNEWRSRGTTTLRRMRVRIVPSLRSFLFQYPLSFSLLTLFHLFHSPILRPLPAGVRIRKCVRHSRKTHILITNSRSRGLLPCLVVTPNPIFQPEWRVGEPESSMIHASERFAPDLNAAVHAPTIIWEISLGGQIPCQMIRLRFCLNNFTMRRISPLDV